MTLTSDFDSTLLCLVVKLNEHYMPVDELQG